MPTAPTSPSTPHAKPSKATETRPETVQYEVVKTPANEPRTPEPQREWASVVPEAPTAAPRGALLVSPPVDSEKWGTPTLVGQQAPVTVTDSSSVGPEGTGRNSLSPGPGSEGTGRNTLTPRPHVTETLQRGATQLADALGTGFRAASRSLAESSPGALEALLSAPSPDLAGADPIVALSGRLAAESDFWRRLGLRSLSRAIIADRGGYLVAGLGVTSGLGLAIVAGLGALFGGAQNVAGRAGILLVGAIAVLCASAVAYAFTNVIRRGQRETARSAFARADRAERRLQRVAVAIALRSGSTAAFHDALRRVTDDESASAPG